MQCDKCKNDTIETHTCFDESYPLCASCQPYRMCDQCDKEHSICERCKDRSHCSGCDDMLDSNDGFDTCDKCEDTYCYTCSGLHLHECHDSFGDYRKCHNCLVVTLSGCCHDICDKCAKECDCCDNSVCEECIMVCYLCESPCCKDCIVESKVCKDCQDTYRQRRDSYMSSKPAQIHRHLNEEFYFYRYVHDNLSHSMIELHDENKRYHEREFTLENALGYTIPEESNMCRWYIRGTLENFDSLEKFVSHMHKVRYTHEYTTYDAMISKRKGYYSYDIYRWKLDIMQTAVDAVGGYPRIWPWRRKQIIGILRGAVFLILSYRKTMAKRYHPDSEYVQLVAKRFKLR